jgi:hypothetical protein
MLFSEWLDKKDMSEDIKEHQKWQYKYEWLRKNGFDESTAKNILRRNL